MSGYGHDHPVPCLPGCSCLHAPKLPLRARLTHIADDLALHTVEPDNDRDAGFIAGLDYAARRIRAALDGDQ